MIVADTDVLIDYLQGKGAAERIGLELAHGQLCITAVTRFELLAGAHTARQRNLVFALLDALPCWPLDSSSADRAAEIQRRLEQSGQPIGMADSLIAGIVLVRRGILLTRNRKHFERIEGLRLGSLG